jgi:hypothetical protein
MYLRKDKLRIRRRVVTRGGEIIPEKEKVMLVFGKPEPKMIETAGLPKSIEAAAVGINELISCFKSYKVDSIELSIEGSVKSGGITNLFISAEGKGGMKVILKPK